MSKKTKKGRLGHVFFIIVVLVIFIIVGISSYLFLQFRTGDFVYNTESGVI